MQTLGDDRIADAILANKHELAGEITNALYREQPQLLERYGPSGRVRCHEDMQFNLEHLAPAVGLGDPTMFARYVQWLAGMLAARGVPPTEVRRSLELTADVLGKRLEGGSNDIVESSIRAGIDALPEPS